MLVAVALSNCKSSDTGSTKQRYSYEQLQERTTSKDFTIAIEVMQPQLTNAVMQVTNELLRNTGNTAGRVDVTRDGHKIRIANDSVYADLPFMGERRMGGGYNNQSTGITVASPLENYETTYIEKSGMHEAAFDATSGIESFRFTITLYRNGFARVNVTPSQRTNVVYTGTLIANEG